jgi:hypothetical protein
LLTRLSSYGVETAVAAVRAGAGPAASVTAVLEERSRIRQVRRLVETTFATRADVLKASSALERLDRLAWDRSLSAGARAWLGDEVEQLRLAPAMHAVAELHALGELAAGRARLPADLAHEFHELVSPTGGVNGTSGAREDLHDLSDRFARFAFDAAPADAHVARVAARSIQLRRAEGRPG